MDEKREINTFIFLDLEATGLPTSGRPRITEISLIAVHRNILLESSSKRHELPRVVNKFTHCIYPMKPVSPGASLITGLYNDVLEYQKDFDSDLVESINLFIRRHESPVCLVAHNGVNFDFALLHSELQSLDSELPADLLCADSLAMFRELDEEVEDLKQPPDIHSYESAEVRRRLIFSPIPGPSASNSTSTKSSSLFRPEPDSRKTPETKSDNENDIGRPYSPGMRLAIEQMITQGLFDDDDNDEDFNNVPETSTITDNMKTTSNCKPSTSKNVTDNETNCTKSRSDVVGTNEANASAIINEKVNSTSIAVIPDDSKPLLNKSSPSGDLTLSDDKSNNCDSFNIDNNGFSNMNKVHAKIDLSSRNMGSGDIGVEDEKNQTNSKLEKIENNINSTPLKNEKNLNDKQTTPSTEKKMQSPWYTPRRLLPETPYKKFKHSYKLGDVHKRVVGFEIKDSHRAEEDCLALLRICQHMSAAVCQWADVNAVNIHRIPEMYAKSPRKRKCLDRGVFPYHDFK